MNYEEYCKDKLNQHELLFWSEERLSTATPYLRDEQWVMRSSEEEVSLKIADSNKFDSLMLFSFQARIDDNCTQNLFELYRDLTKHMEFTRTNIKTIHELINGNISWWYKSNVSLLPTAEATEVYIVYKDLQFLCFAWEIDGTYGSFNWGQYC